MAMSSDRNADMSRVINELTRAINSLEGKIGQMGSGGAGSKTRTGAVAGGRTNGADKTEQSLKDLKKTIKDTDKDLDKLRKGINDSTKSYGDLYDAQAEAVKGILKNSKMSEKVQNDLIDRLHKTATAGSALGASMTKTGEKLAFLEKSIEESTTFLAEYSDALKDAGTETLSSIKDWHALQKALKTLDNSIELSADVKEHIAKQEYRQAAALLDKEKKQHEDMNDEVKKTTKSFTNLDASTKRLKGGFAKATDMVGLGFVKKAAEWGGAFAMVTEGAKELYGQFWSTASAGFGGAFMNLSVAAIKLGINLQDLTALTKANMVQVGKMGLKGFTDSLAESRIQLMQLGLTSVEAAKMKAVMNENARLTGVDIKNKGALNDATQSQIAAFESLRATTGESLEALAEQTKAILNDNDTMRIMGGLNKQQRVQMLQGINAERVRLTTMGLTNDAAVGVIKSLNAITNMKTTDRIEAGNQAMAAASALGMDPDQAQKANSIMLKGNAASQEEKAFLANFSKEMVGRKDQMQASGDLNQQMLADQADAWTTKLAGVESGMRQGNLDRGMSQGEIENNKELGRIAKSTAEFTAKLDTWIKLIQSPLVTIGVGIAGLLYLVGKKLLPKIGKKGKDGSGSGRDEGGADDSSPSESKKVKGKAGSDQHTHPNGAKVKGGGALGSKTSQQIEHMARNDGWLDDHEKGYAGFNNRAKKIKADKEYAGKQATNAGREAQNKQGIGSPELQRRLAQHKMDRERFAGPPREMTPPPAPSIGDRFKSAWSGAKGAASNAGSAVVNAAKSPGKTIKGAVGKVGSVLKGTMGSIARLGIRVLPWVGAAVAGIEAFQGGMDAVNRAGEIFGVDTQKESLTTAQKVSAGIAGALNTLSMGLIPTDGTARLLNDVATDGVGVLTDYIEKGYEFFYNKAVPALYQGLKNVLGFVWDAITGLFNGNASDNNSITGTILDAMRRGILFMGTLVLKGIMKVGTDLIGGLAEKIPDWLGGQAIRDNVKMMKGFASEDTKVSDFDSAEQAKDRKKRDEDKAKRDKLDDGKGGTKVQGSTTEAPKDNLGLVNEFGAALSADQLAAQGIQAKPAAQNSPSVSGGASGNGTNGSGDSTVVNNTTNNTTQSPPKTQSEQLLSNILDKMTSLVDLTDKGLKIAEAEYKTSTQQRLAPTPMGNSGFAPSLADFMNMTI